jgi:hypothetical protein
MKFSDSVCAHFVLVPFPLKGSFDPKTIGIEED